VNKTIWLDICTENRSLYSSDGYKEQILILS